MKGHVERKADVVHVALLAQSVLYATTRHPAQGATVGVVEFLTVVIHTLPTLGVMRRTRRHVSRQRRLVGRREPRAYPASEFSKSLNQANMLSFSFYVPQMG